MAFLSALVDHGTPVKAHRPWPRVSIDGDTWRQAVLGLAAGEATLLGLWSDGADVHMAVADPAYAKLAVLSLAAAGRRFPSVGLTHTPAQRLERAIPPGMSLFQVHPHTVVSLDYIKSQERRAHFLHHCPGFVIVDEAHACVGNGQGRIRIPEDAIGEYLGRCTFEPKEQTPAVPAARTPRLRHLRHP